METGGWSRSSGWRVAIINVGRRGKTAAPVGDRRGDLSSWSASLRGCGPSPKRHLGPHEGP
eukprot:361545-Chlamydomonas_euryale.AAC.4